MELRLRRRPKLWEGLVAGLCGGLAGSIAMTQFQNGWSKGAQALSENGSQRQSSEQSDEENATMKMAGVLARLAGRQLSFPEKKKAGLAVHYSFGTAMGALYGVAAEISPTGVRRHPALSGLAFGGSLFIAGDEVVVPKLGLSAGKAPLSFHLYALASHAVYGLAAGFVHAQIREKL